MVKMWVAMRVYDGGDGGDGGIAAAAAAAPVSVLLAVDSASSST